MMKHKFKYYNRRESGVALVFAIGLLGLMLAVGLAFLGNALIFKKVARNNSSRTQARMLVLSAANRAAASIMVYQQQAIDNDDAPANFDKIYSYGAYDSDGKSADSGTMITDGLLKKTNSSSKMLLLEDSSLVEKSFAVAYNTRFKKEKSVNEAWDGSWVFFYNKKSGNDREIVGRAAWQVVTSSAQILAPVFLRGKVEKIDPDDATFRASNHRWGREIDEVYLDENDGTPDFINDKIQAITPDTKINDFESLFSYLKDDTAVQTWIKTWLIPDFTEEDGYGTVAKPFPIFPEVYVYQKDKKGPKQQLMRFNISEGDYGSDKWYGRLGISADSDKNSKTAVHKLTLGSLLYLPSKEPQKDKDIAEKSGLPFLRLIGHAEESGASFRSADGGDVDMMAWRKQIAGNFNDYCDEDSIPTSDVKAEDWLQDLPADYTTDFADKIPTFTGNEKTPYLYEFGMNFGIMPAESAATEIKTTSTGDGSYSLAVRLQALPVLKLANIYDFKPDEAFSAISSDDKFMNGYVDFGKTEVTFAPKALTLKKVKFSFDETIDEVKYSRTATVDVKIEDANSFKSAFAADLTMAPEAEVWKNNDGNVKNVPVPFAKSKLDNQTGTNPYPLFYAKNEADTDWQYLKCTVNDINFAVELKDFRTGTGNGLPEKVKFENFETTGTQNITSLSQLESALKDQLYNITVSNQAEDVVLEKVDLKKVSIKPRRLVLTGKEKNSNNEIGVDFAGHFEEIKWERAAGADTEISLVPDNDAKRAGVLIGGGKNYDPRQNLYGADWMTSNVKMVKLADFKNPSLAEIKSAMDIDDAGDSGLVNSGDPKFSPQNSSSGSFDKENVAEPAYTGGENRLSTAYIRNAPMMSPWEIGAIHRGLRWQTLNIKKAGNPGNSDDFSADSFEPKFNAEGSDVDDDWKHAGTKYSDGDGALLEQIKMTDRVDSYGKINVNLIGKNDLDINIVNALFNGVVYNQKMGDFIKESTRTAGEFPAVGGNSNEKDVTSDESVFTKMKAASNLRPFGSRAEFLNFVSSGTLANVFGKVTLADNDAAQEEIIGKTINLLGAETTSPAMVQVVIVAQSIKDRKGVQVRATSETSKGKFTAIDGSTVDDIEDGTVSLECKLGKFDALEHGENDDLNVYFDEITGEVKAMVTFVRDPATGRLFINRIDYLSD